MSSVMAALRRTGGAFGPVVRRRAVVYAVVAALVVGGLVTARVHSGGASGRPSAQAGVGGPGGTGNGNGSGPNGHNNSGISGATPSAGGQPGQSPGAANGPGAHGTPSPTFKPLPTPKQGDAVTGRADVLHSNCAEGYEPGQQCTVYYGGTYELFSQPTGKIIFQVTIDGVQADWQGYVAPKGAFRFGGNLKFTVPPHAKKIVYQSLLEDATGKVLAQSPEQITYGYG